MSGRNDGAPIAKRVERASVAASNCRTSTPLLVIDRSTLPGRCRKAGIGGKLAPVVIVAGQAFGPQDGGKLRPDAFERKSASPGQERWPSR